MDPRDQYQVLSETYGVVVGTTISSLTIPDGARACMIFVESQDIRVKFNSTNSVTTGVTYGVGGGCVLPVNTIAQPFHLIEGYDLMNRMRLRRSGSTNSSVNIVFLGYGDYA